MSPTSYQGPSATSDAGEKTYSQTEASNMRLATGKVTVEDVLGSKGATIHSAAPTDLLSDAVAKLHAHRIGVLLVLEGESLIGILSERDVVNRLGAEGPDVLNRKVSEVMTANPVVSARSDLLLSVLRKMSEGGFRHMPVMDEDKVIGLVSIKDVVEHRLREVEYEALQLKQMIVG